MHACRQENTLEDILTAVKSKRYTRSRLDRMVLCAFL
jgi:predicted nucleotidyltransferase